MSTIKAEMGYSDLPPSFGGLSGHLNGIEINRHTLTPFHFLENNLNEDQKKDIGVGEQFTQKEQVEQC